jgi:hypothetical protein
MRYLQVKAVDLADSPPTPPLQIQLASAGGPGVALPQSPRPRLGCPQCHSQLLLWAAAPQTREAWVAVQVGLVDLAVQQRWGQGQREVPYQGAWAGAEAGRTMAQCSQWAPGWAHRWQRKWQVASVGVAVVRVRVRVRVRVSWQHGVAKSSPWVYVPVSHATAVDVDLSENDRLP